MLLLLVVVHRHVPLIVKGVLFPLFMKYKQICDTTFIPIINGLCSINIGRQRKTVHIWHLLDRVWAALSATGSRNNPFIQNIHSCWVKHTQVFHCRYLLTITTGNNWSVVSNEKRDLHLTLWCDQSTAIVLASGPHTWIIFLFFLTF